MDKKAVELSINVIIIVVLGLLVMAVLVFITTGKLGDFRQGVSCDPAQCQLSAEHCESNEAAVRTTCMMNDDREGSVCCVPVSGGGN